MDRESTTINSPVSGGATGTQQEEIVAGMAHAAVEAPRHPTAVKGFRLGTFNSLRYRDYRLLWFSILFTSAGQWAEQIALSWLVYQITDSALMLGAINGVRALPFLLIGPWAGVAADRVDRKKLMWFSQAYIMVLTAGISVLIISGRVEVWHLFVFSFFNALGWSFTQPVRQALIPNLVPKDELMNAVALQSAGFNSTRLWGPAAAGLLIGWIGPGAAFAAKALLYVVILVLLAMMRVPPTPATARERSVRHNLLEGFRYIGRNQVVFSLILLALIPMLLAFPVQTLLPVFARDILEMGPKGYGVIVSFAGIGALAATLGVASLGTFQHKGMLLIASAIALGVSLIVFANSAWLPTSLFFMVFVGGFQMTYMSLNNTLLHLNITDDLRGRVMSIYMLDQGVMPLGSLVVGAVADVFSAPLAVTLMGASCILMAVVAMARVPVIRRLP